jgi:uncharacterized damage-inducible protein DinB
MWPGDARRLRALLLDRGKTRTCARHAIEFASQSAGRPGWAAALTPLAAFNHGAGAERGMNLLNHTQLMARYNQWMNTKVYEAAGRLPAAELGRDRQAFFGSVLGTLNHIMVGDIVWLKRLGTHPAAHRSLDVVREMQQPASLDEIVHRDLAGLQSVRKALDAVILAWAAELTQADLDHVLDYRNMKGVAQRKLFGSLVLNLFNHQTHHRGQATTLLFQAGQDVGVTDLLALIPEEQA